MDCWSYEGYIFMEFDLPDIEVNTILFEARLCEVLERTMFY